MKITILVDNKDGGQFKGEWGLSFYIEYREKTILLDAGLSGLFAENAKAMGIDLRNVDMAVLSHAHDDHANGLDTFFGINDRAPLYVAHGCDENCYDRNEDGYKYAGIPLGFMTRHANRIVRSDGDMYISDGIRLLGHITPGLEEIGLAENMYLKQGNEFVPDDFRHEQSLIFETEEGIVVFNSCSHAGADNIVNEARQMYPESSILAMIGGFHLFNKSAEYVEAFAERLESTGVRHIYTGHCTGDKAFGILQNRLGSKVHGFCTGLVFELP